MIRIAISAAYALAVVLGVLLMQSGSSLGLPFVEAPIWRLAGLVLTGFAIWRLLIGIFGVTPEPRRTRPASPSESALIMKGPRFQSDRHNAPTRIGIRD
jgi:hypothetical protein